MTLVGRMLCGDNAVLAFSDRLNRLPLTVFESWYIDLGSYHGLTFGVVLHPLGGSELFMQGDAVRRAYLRRDARGLAVLNTLNRLARGYEEAAESNEQELALAESQLRDSETRQGAAFTHEEYLKELSALREQLRIALSGIEAKDGESAAEEPGTMRIRRRVGGAHRCRSREPAGDARRRQVAA